MKTIGIVGSRRRVSVMDFVKCRKAFDEIYEPGDRIVSGGCPTGGDAFAEKLARARGLTIIIHHADWKGPAGRGAGLARNTKIAEDCDVLIALIAEDRTGGAEDTIRKAKRLKKPIVLV